MKKTVKNIILLIALLLMGMIQIPSNGQAAELNFAVEAIIPENQRDKTKTYFDLRVEPNSEQTIEMNLRNDTEKDVTVEPSVNTAITNINGVVEYGETKTKTDSTLPIDLKKIVTVSNEITIPAKSLVKVPLTIKMPETKFDGILSGGITIKEKADSADSEGSNQDGQGLAINNKYAYVVALLLNQTDQEVKPKLELNNVEPSQINLRNVINANLQNVESTYINSMNIDAKVTKKGAKETVYESSKKNMQMAPNSNFDYPIALEGQRLEAGDYTLTLNVDAKEDSWSFTKDFTIKSEDAKKYNQTDVTIKKNNTWIYVLVGLLLILIVGILIFFIIKQKKKKEEEERKQLLARKKKLARRKKRREQELKAKQ
ncbi:DUF916 and DUF3324 domain-containing protein [Carnobacterium gallinarum]|uniref:DUF916 and DUF3324 domain-containing protein n=1 Tax=Carnobacterium gallinarum TaxID=2749 RepID=UPI00054F1A62|nr:DUF916 and DUF3324 domain-containing protein [Carnobacterium gallinarum]